MADKALECRDCSGEFIFTEKEQAWFKEKGLQNEPKRCPDCRKARRQNGFTYRDCRKEQYTNEGY